MNIGKITQGSSVNFGMGRLRDPITHEIIPGKSQAERFATYNQRLAEKTSATPVDFTLTNTTAGNGIQACVSEGVLQTPQEPAITLAEVPDFSIIDADQILLSKNSPVCLQQKDYNQMLAKVQPATIFNIP